jgi:ATP-dependent Zn protease
MKDAEALAFHQAGHAVLSWLSRGETQALNIAVRGKAGGCAILPIERKAVTRGGDQVLAWREEKETAVRAILGGVMAEDMASASRREDFESEDDFRRARTLVAELAGSYAELIAYLQLLCVQTEDQLRTHWHRVDAVAKALLARKSLTAKEAAAVIAGSRADTAAGRPRPVRA